MNQSRVRARPDWSFALRMNSKFIIMQMHYRTLFLLLLVDSFHPIPPKQLELSNSRGTEKSLRLEIPACR